MSAAVAEIVGTHPYADKFPMLPEADLADLAESIRANGLRQPIVLTEDGLILDGRNRAAACERIGIEPETVIYDGSDLAEFVIDCNVTRRNMSTGARAMATALVLADDGRRENGRWQYGLVTENPDVGKSLQNAIAQSGVVLDYTPGDAALVVSGEMTLNSAFENADKIRKSAEADKIREREMKKRERDEAKEQAERNSQIVADLTQADQGQYVDLIDSGAMTPAAAWAAFQEDTRKERERERELDRGRRDTVTRIAECVRFLNTDPETFLRDFYPHEERFLADGMRLTRERVQDAIDFLAAIQKEITQ